ncbi:MAG TPA: hypothetical protein VF444_25160 [Pseudonocardiaceae bacterium]
MSALSETVEYTRLATASCQEVAGFLLQASRLMGDITRSLRAGLDGTGQITEAAQYHQRAASSLTDSQQAVQLLQQHLEGLVARFHEAA